MEGMLSGTVRARSNWQTFALSIMETNMRECERLVLTFALEHAALLHNFRVMETRNEIPRLLRYLIYFYK